jgi:hypothetical protein
MRPSGSRGLHNLGVRLSNPFDGTTERSEKALSIPPGEAHPEIDLREETDRLTEAGSRSAR